MYRGGIADKVGNRYEARWLTHQLLRLLDGTVQAVTVEALGDDGQGFEFSLDRVNGSEWHQCKRQTTAGTWTIPALDAAGVLTAFRTKTSATGDRCLFISSDPAPQLKLLQDKLPAAHNIEAFQANLSKVETQHWGVLKERLSCNDTDAFDFLSSTEFRTLSEHDLAENLRARIAYWFKGDPDVVAAQFRTWLEEDRNFNRPICYDDVIGFARDAGIKTKQYELDRALPGRIRDATANYVSSYPCLGAGLFRIKRTAVREVITGLQADARVVLLAGAAGVGKSAIIAEVIEKLQSDGTLHLAFRVDQAGAVATLDELGAQTVGTFDNPLVVLEQLAANKHAVLIIDQADAVSEVSGRIAALRRVVLELVRKATLYPRVQLIFACRSFDLENDHAYREIAEAEGNVRVDIPPFQRTEVEPVLAKLGILYDGNNSRLMALLALPIGLTLAAALAKSGINDLRRVEHLSELYSRLLTAREQEIQREFRPGWSIYATLTAMAAAMSERQELVAPAATLDPFAGALDLLQRIGMIVVRGQRVGFIHESLFDYLHARAFVQERKPLIDFLLASEQTLFRRTQTRQILSFERELERTRYLDDLDTILSDTRVRPHIRETVVRWLATIADPSRAEWDLITRYGAGDGLPIKTGKVIYERKPWFDFLDAEGVLDAWLASEGDDFIWALGFLRSVAPLAPGPVAKRIDSLLEQRPDRIQDMLRMLRFIDPKAGGKPIADNLVAALDRAMPGDLESGGDDWGNYYGNWVKDAPTEAARIFGAQLRCWSRHYPEDYPLERRLAGSGSATRWISDLAQAAPLAFLEQILPFMRLAMERSVKDSEFPAEDSIWYWRRSDRAEVRLVTLLDVVRGTLRKAARLSPEATMRLLRALQPRTFITSLHLLLETIPANPEALHGLLMEQFDNPGLFEAGWYGADGHSAGSAFAAAMPWLNETERQQAEAAIFAIRPEIDLAKSVLDRHDAAAGGPCVPAKTRDLAIYRLNKSGKREWSVLLQIATQHLTPRAAKRLAELNRKFVGQKPDEPDGIRGGMVRSPISGERTKFMNDEAWLSAVRKLSSSADGWRWRGDGLKGGARELSLELKERAKESPERFLAILARFPEGTYQDFAWGVIMGIAEAKPEPDMIERVLAIADMNPAARPDDRTLIWMIRACVGPLGSRAEELLIKIALGEDDSSGIGEVNRGETEKEPEWKRAFAIGSHLNGKAINSARGSALAMLGSMCWDSKDMFEKYKPVIDPIIGQSAAAHIHSSMTGLLMSALKHDGKHGIAWTLRTAHACPEALYTRDGQQIIGWVAELDSIEFRKLVNLYLINDDAPARSFAALAIFQKCLDDPDWLQLAEELIEADAENRSAAAAVAATNFESVRFGTTCTSWLIRLFDDADKFVRDEASDCFRQMRTENIATHAGLFEAYAASRYFETGRTFFLHRLKHAPARLDELVLKLLEDIVAANAKGNRDPHAYELREIGELVLKLYAASVDHPDRRTRALNLIDRLVAWEFMDMQKLDAA